MGYEEQVAVIIPSLNPDEKMLRFIDELKKAGFIHILIVNDGSGQEYNTYYEVTKEQYGCTVFTHSVNLGKGRALKNAFNYILTNLTEVLGVVTVDSDGQHSALDTHRCAKALLQNIDSLIMGCRSFRDKSIPFRSRAGNIITCKVLKLLSGIEISDTQTGLRAMSVERMKKVMNISGERFEYEMNMLLSVREECIPIVEVPIETIYLENNKSSHFNPLVDSIKIYSLFLRFLSVSIASFFIDILLFILFNSVTKFLLPTYYITISTALSRFLSSLFNYSTNRKKVFRSVENSPKVFLKYYSLCFFQMLISAFAVTYLYSFFGAHVNLIKIAVDSAIFLISYQIQMKWVFKNTPQKNRTYTVIWNDHVNTMDIYEKKYQNAN
jgi:putative flippase GtrA